MLTPSALAHVELLTADFGRLVDRHALLATLTPSIDRSPPSSRRPRTLDLQIGRLRRRIKGVGLTVSAVRGRGYVLEHARLLRQPSGSRPT